MNKKNGVALVTALVLMMVLVAVISVLTIQSLGEFKQSKNSIIASEARNVAEGGVVYATAMIQSKTIDIVSPLVTRYSSSFIANGGDPATDPVIPEDEWDNVAATIENTLNSNYSTISSSDLGGAGRVNIQYRVSNFRIAQLSSSGNGFTQVYTADYAVTATGRTDDGGRKKVVEKGYLNVTLGRPSLSQWLFLVEDAGGRRGFFGTGSVFNGPVHANQNWGFWGRPRFTDLVTSSDGGAWFWDIAGTCRDGLGRRVFMDAAARPPCTRPIFQAGYNWNVPRVELPTNSLSQERAALGLAPDTDDNNDGVPDAPTPRERCQQLNISPCTGIPNGVYLINDGSRVTGGIYVQGNLDSLLLSAGGDGTQTYQFNQSGRTWTITVDYNNDTTTITNPSGASKTYSGVPNGHAPLGTGGPTGQIYVTGSIGTVRSPSRTGWVARNSANHPPPAAIQPALSLETQLNITARGEIGIFNDLIYECDPMMMNNSNYLASHPRCSSVTGELKTVLGMFSETEDITILRNGGLNDIYLWGSFLSADDDKGLAVAAYNSRGDQGTMHLFGGLIQWQDQLRGVVDRYGNLISGYYENFQYDTRFRNSHLSPPNFPTTRAFQLQSVNAMQLLHQDR